jgi:hypothetical protein
MDDVQLEERREHTLKLLADPVVQTLMQSMQRITMTAISETARLCSSYDSQCNDNSQDSSNKFFIPHIAQQMIHELPSTSGSDPISLSKFLVEVDKIISLNLATENSILANIIPLTTNRLRAVWLQAQSMNMDWMQLQAHIRANLFTPRLIRDMQTTLIFRKQGTNETLSHFVAEINGFFQILAPGFSARDKFDTIFTGLNTTTRYSFAGLPVPSTVEDLIKLCPMVDALRLEESVHYSKNLETSQHGQLNYQDNPRKFNRNMNNKQQYIPKRDLEHQTHVLHQPQHNGLQNLNDTSRSNQYRSHSHDRVPYIPPFPQELADLTRITAYSNWPQKSTTVEINHQQKPRTGQWGVKKTSGLVGSRDPTRSTRFGSPVVPRCTPLTVPININKLETKAILDTGSTISIVSMKFFKTIQSNKQVVTSIQTVTNSAITANGSHVNFQYRADVHIKIQHLSWTFPFLVSNNLPVDVILGLDFIQYTNMNINAARRQISFPYDTTLMLYDSGPSYYEEEEKHADSPTFGTQLTQKQIQEFTQLIGKFPTTVTKKVGETKLIEYDIQLKSDKVIRSRPYYYAPPKLDLMRKHVQELLEKGIIRPSDSSYSSPAFLVGKKGTDKTRLVVNYKELNNIMEIPNWPVETVESAFQNLGSGTVFSTIDLVSAYNQIPLTERSKQFTSFVVPTGQYEYNRIPFGIASGSMVLSKLMDKIFSDIKYKFLYPYFDDIVIYSDSVASHLKHLDIVLARLRDAGLTVSPGKMVIGTHKIEFLGHIFENGKVSLNPDRTKPIDQFPTPTNIKKLAKFLGMCSFYSRFIPNFSQITQPLNHLKRKGVQWTWGQEQEAAFQNLKKALVAQPVLRLPDFNNEFYLQTDASGSGLGAVLSQKVDGHLAPIAYASRPLNRHERRYGTFELEGLGVVFALTKFRQYLEHRQFHLHTDNSALSFILNHPRQIGKIGRWITLLNSFQFTVTHIKGIDNSAADFLSRLYEESNETHTETHPTAQTIEIPLEPQCFILTKIPEAFRDIITHQKQDNHLRKTRRMINAGQPPTNYRILNDLIVYQTVNQRTPRAVIPEKLFDLLFKFYHESPLGPHLGIKKTIHKINRYFYAPTLTNFITEKVRTCDVCQKSKQAPNNKVGLLASDYATRPFQNVFCDYIGPLPRTKKGNKWLLVVTDAFSKYSVMLPAKNSTAATTIGLLERGLFAYFGHPLQLVSDRGPCFKADTFKQFCLDLGIKHRHTSPYYPKPSHTERQNKNIGVALRVFHSGRHEEWDTNLHLFQVAFNSAKHESTGTSPAELFLGYPISTPLENNWNLDELLQIQDNENLEEKWQKAIGKLQKAHEKVKKQYNQGRQENLFRTGERVMYRKINLSDSTKQISKKLQPLWSRPLIINRFLSPVTVELKCPTTGRIIRTAHVSHIKKYNLFNANLRATHT